MKDPIGFISLFKKKKKKAFHSWLCGDLAYSLPVDSWINPPCEFLGAFTIKLLSQYGWALASHDFLVHLALVLPRLGRNQKSGCANTLPLMLNLHQVPMSGI